MFKILTMNQISAEGLKRFPDDRYEIVEEAVSPDAIIVRSSPITADNLPDSLLAIARAGAGVDKICIEECAMKGVPVFNTPGANANSVKELTVLSLLLASRWMLRSIRFTDGLKGQSDDPKEITRIVEKEKKKFIGREIIGKTLGVIGLGAIGSKVAEIAIELGMKVLGYDPALSVESAWRLSNKVERIEDLSSLLSRSDFITLHLPMLESTRYMINRESLKHVKKGAFLLNFSREAVVDPEAVVEALDSGVVSRFICDFPHPILLGRDDVILTPHIGASTIEAEQNCAIMAVDQIMDFLNNGNIQNSVNFPNIHLERSSQYRLSFSNKNVPNMLGQVLGIMADHHFNVMDMLNRSRGDIAYTLIDTDNSIPTEMLRMIQSIDGIYSVRVC